MPNYSGSHKPAFWLSRSVRPCRPFAFTAALLIFMILGARATAEPLLVGKATFSAFTEIGVDQTPQGDTNGVGAHVSDSVKEESGGFPAQASAQADADVLPSSPPLLATAGTEAFATNDRADASAEVDFNFAVVEAHATRVPVFSVPLDIGGLLFAHVEAVAPSPQFVSIVTAKAIIDIGPTVLGPRFGEIARAQCVNEPIFGCDPDVTEHLGGEIEVSPDTEEQVRLVSLVTIDDEQRAGAAPFTSAEARAIADPTIVIDPSFEFKDDFELVFSDNLTPEPSPSSVSEPPSWALMIFALTIFRLVACRSGWQPIKQP